MALGLAAVACADTTTAPTDAGGDELGSVDTAAPVDDQAAAESDPVSEEVVDDAVAPSSSSSSVPAAIDPAPAEPVVTEPAAAEPPVEEPPAATTDPFDGVATIYGGSGSESPWAPLGWWDGSAWNEVRFDEAGDLMLVPEPDLASVSVTSLDLGDGPGSVIDGLALGEQQEYCVGPETGPLINLPVVVPETMASLGYDAVAVSADWPLQPRPVRQVGLEVVEYATVGAALFSSVTDAAVTGEVLQVVRADLDGNGVEEVLVTFENVTPDFGAAGDFAGVYARYPSADGTVVDELVVSYVPDAPVDFPTIGRFSIAAVADLNGDGVMEVILRDMFWESAGMGVYALQDGRLVQVARGGCGV